MAGRGGRQVIPRPPSARPGRPAPWAELAPERRRIDVAAVRAALAAAGPARPSPFESPTARRSAVLAPLYDEGGAASVVLTRRAQHLRAHRGEVSFPGGGGLPGEDAVATALRETEEEIGLAPSAVEVIGELDHLTTVSSASVIVPLVGVLPPGRPDLAPNPGEVEAVLFVSLEELLADGVYREERWVGPGLDRPISFFELEGDTVWGATASMLRQLLAVATGTAA